MKKGSSHVDWAISMGLFITYLMLMLIFIRPGIEPIYDETTLVNNVKSNFQNDSYSSVDKTPFYMSLKNVGSRDYVVTIDGLNLESPLTKYTVLNSSMDFVKCRIESNKVSFDAYMSSGNTYTYYLIHADNFTYQNTNPQNILEITKANLTFSKGVIEKTSGISTEKLKSIQDYDKLKTKWKYPSDKEFMIRLYNTTYLNYSQKDIIFSNGFSGEIDEENVFVSEWRDFLIDKKGYLHGVIINMRIW